jgi:hypothetical protein
MIDHLEPRRLLAATPVTAVTINGTAGQINGVVLTFNVPLDPTTAQNVKAYSISKKTKGDDSSFGVIDTSSPGSTRRVRFKSAVYDPDTQTVTLTPDGAFDLGRRFKRVRISGNGPNTIMTATGAPLDGNGDGTPGGDAILHSRVVRASRFNYREADGDMMRLKLTGPGVLRVWSDHRRNVAPDVFLFGTNASQSTLTGTVKKGRHGDGVVTLHQISGTATAVVPLLDDPAFRVEVNNP